MNERLKTVVPQLAGQRVLVVGDVILDEYLIGKAVRMSREAPIPVLEFEQRQHIPGGAANPSANVAALGSTAVMAGVVGADAAADSLRGLLDARGIITDALVTDAQRPTTLKTRIMAHMGLRFPQQVARIDTLSRAAINGTVEQPFAALLGREIGQARTVLISDYGGGLLTPSIVERIRTEAANATPSPLLVVDAQNHLAKYTGFGVVKCNADDASAYLRRDLVTDADFGAAAAELCRVLALTRAMVITRGADGATTAETDGRITHCRAPAVTDVYDTVGAGDTAIAVLALALGAGASVPDAVHLANYASGLVVRRVGNYTPTRDELLWALDTWSIG